MHLLIIRNILKAYAFNVLHFKCMTTFTIAMTMPDILINTENIFLNRGICELLREGANKQVISSQADSLIKISRIWAD
ncbi:hypothetical protein ACYZCU_28275, partial [Klebsiella pneumoniae]|nr:hypothetical protein [Klebsiella pneumoniae]